MNNLGRSKIYEPRVTPVTLAQLNRDFASAMDLDILDNAYLNFNPYFQMDVWTMQVLALWLTDGECYKDYDMQGIITMNGFDPKDPSPVMLPYIKNIGVRAIPDLSNVLKKIPKNKKVIGGPDGIFNQHAERLLKGYILSRGKGLCSKLLPNELYYIVLDRLAKGVSSPSLRDAIQKVGGSDASSLSAIFEMARGSRASRRTMRPVRRKAPSKKAPIKRGGVRFETHKKPVLTIVEEEKPDFEIIHSGPDQGDAVLEPEQTPVVIEEQGPTYSDDDMDRMFDDVGPVTTGQEDIQQGSAASGEAASGQNNTVAQEATGGKTMLYVAGGLALAVGGYFIWKNRA